MIEYPPEFLRRLKAINRRRIQLVREVRYNYMKDLESIKHSIDQEIQFLNDEFDIPVLEDEEETE